MRKKKLKLLRLLGVIGMVGCVIFLAWLIMHPLKVETPYQVEAGEPIDMHDPIIYAAFGHKEDVQIEGKVDFDQVGEQCVTYVYHNKRYSVCFDVKDTTVPVVKTKDVTEDLIGEVKPEDFIQEVNDHSEVSYHFEDPRDMQKEGEHHITILAEDAYGNQAKAEAVLHRIKDTQGPQLSGLDDMQIKQGKEADYQQGISVQDDYDPSPQYQYDDHLVDSTKPGIYHVTYTASDRSGNVCTVERKVTVEKDPAYGSKVVYLTFDDGPSPNTAKVLDVLKKYHAQATFFVTGTSLGQNHLIARAFHEGHTIGLHTYTHDYDTVYASEEAYFKDLQQVSEMVEGITGKKSNLIRFPGGSSNTVSARTSPGLMTKLTKEVEDKGYVYFDWNVSSGDASGRNVPVQQIINNAVSSHAQDIVLLMHDTYGKETTAEALPSIIENYKSKGYIFLGLQEDSFSAHHHVNN